MTGAGGPRERAERGLAGFRLPASRRIRKRPDFLRIQSGGRRITTPSYVLLVAARDDDAPARLGITATRKFGNAVERNRAKRVLREAFRLHPELFPKGADLVVIVRGEAARIPLARAVAELETAAPALAKRVAEMRGLLARGADPLHTARKPR